jgi:hypothetical protein
MSLFWKLGGWLAVPRIDSRSLRELFGLGANPGLALEVCRSFRLRDNPLEHELFPSGSEEQVWVLGFVPPGSGSLATGGSKWASG